MNATFDFMNYLKKSFMALAVLGLVAACGRGDDKYVSDAPAPDDSVGTVETFPDRPDLAARLGEESYSEYETPYNSDDSSGSMGVPSSYEEEGGAAESKSYFDLNKHNIRSDAASVLRRQARWLMSNPEVRVVVAGHCDARGSREYNLALGERRANAVKDFLVSQGVSASRISTVSYGKERPAALGDTEAAYALNRRAVTTIAR